MSTYLDMWNQIKTLDMEQTNEWIHAMEPAKGISVDFKGVRVLDVDLLEALRNYFENYSDDLGRVEQEIRDFRRKHNMTPTEFHTSVHAQACNLRKRHIEALRGN